MIYLKLFLAFLKIGAVSFGGGYGMIALIREETILNGWMDENTFLDMIAVSESTPGPLAVNMATFIGASQAGVLGALLATLGVVLPAFIIILVIAAALKNLMKYAGVEALLGGIRPVIAGLIAGTAVIMILQALFAVRDIYSPPHADLKAIIIMEILVILDLAFKIKGKKISPILLIIISAGLGVGLYAIPI